MLTDDQLADRIGPRLHRELADIAAPDDLPARLRRRQARNALRSIGATAAAVAVAAGAGTLAAMSAGPASHVPATLDAWTVTTRPHGDVTVTIRAIYDPAGLQRKLHEAGIPAHVAVGLNPGPACRAVEAFYLGPDTVSVGQKNPPKGVPPMKNEAVFTIHRAGIPRGLGLAISLSQTRSAYRKSASIRAGFKYVKRSSKCAGS
jgi:hypothetical protein